MLHIADQILTYWHFSQSSHKLPYRMTSGDSPEKRWNPVYGLAITEDIWEAEAKDYNRKKQLELDQQKLEAQRRASVTGNQDTNTKFNKTRIIKVPDKDITYRQYYSYDDIFFDEE